MAQLVEQLIRNLLEELFAINQLAKPVKSREIALFFSNGGTIDYTKKNDNQLFK